MKSKFWKRGIWLTGITVAILASAAIALAADGGEPETDAATAVQPVSNQVSNQVSVKKKVRRRRANPGEKETDGTEAPNRFKADTVIWSPYRLNGKPLEVDPD